MADLWTLAPVVARRAAEHPERPLVVAGTRRLTYGQLDAQASALAAALADLGITEGDRIAVHLPSCPEWLVTLVAAAKLGAVLVPVSPRLNFHELKYQLRHAEASCVVTAEHHRGIDYLQLFETLLPDLPDLHYLVTVGDEELWYDDRIFQFEDLLSKGSGRSVPVPQRVGEDSDLALLYTSGTTGKPKGVRLGHRGVLETAMRTGEAIELSPDDRVFAAVPLFAGFGFGVAVGAMALGTTLVLQEEFDAAAALRLIEQERVTVLHGVPTTFHLLMREPGFDPARLRAAGLRTGIVAGSPVSEALAGRIRRWCDVQIAYGLTETGPTSPSRASPTGGEAADHRRTPAAGRRGDGGRCRQRRPARPARGRRRDRRARTRRHARLRAHARRDRARLHARGVLPHGRPGHPRRRGLPAHRRSAQGDHRARRLPDLPRARSRTSCARTRPSTTCASSASRTTCSGELVCACVVPVEGAVVTGADLRSFARDTMADHKIPDLVRFFDDFPMTGSGKVRRRELERTIALDPTVTAGV
jgi:fatty-acyl-CoA synthase